MLQPGNGVGMDRAGLKKLRLLIVGGKPHAIATLRTVFGIIGINQVCYTADSVRAIELLRHEEFDAVFADDAADKVGLLAFPLAARRARGVINPMLPIYLVCASPLRHQVEGARNDGVTDVLARPISAATVIRKLRVAVLAPRPFIMAGEFFGPDRRGGARAPYGGDDRRTRTPKRMKVSAGETAALLAQGAPSVPALVDSQN